MSKRKRITVSVITDLTTDQRVIRICTTLQKMGFDVLVIARNHRQALPLGQYPFKVIRFKAFFNHGVMLYAEFMMQLFFRLLFVRTDYFLANDLDSLLPNYCVAGMRRKYLFYDTHEYFTGVPELEASPFKKKIWKSLENWLLPKLKVIYTVNNSVKKAYESEYNISLSVIRNVPFKSNVSPAELPENLNGKIILLVQGAGLNTGRNCVEMIEALPLLDDRFHLIFIGGGNAWEDLKTRREELKLQDRIDMRERMPPEMLKSYTKLGHLGISLDSFDSKNFLFNLPNKIFDYLMAGIPIFATAIPEVKQIINEYDCGVYITDTSPASIATAITDLFQDEQRYRQLCANAVIASNELNWEKEQKKLEEIYRPFL